MGGLGLYDLRTEAGLEALKRFRIALYTNSEAGNLICLNLQYSEGFGSGLPSTVLPKSPCTVPDAILDTILETVPVKYQYACCGYRRPHRRVEEFDQRLYHG